VVDRALARSGVPLPGSLRAQLSGAFAGEPALRGRDDRGARQVGGRLVGRPDSPAELRAAEAAERATGPSVGRPAGPAGPRFDSVRVHDDRAAGRAARALGARAFALGEDVFFAPGQYQPSSPGGRGLIAHELAHVVQARGAEPVIMRQPGDDVDRSSPEYLRGYNDGRANNPSAPGPLTDKGLADYDAGYGAGLAESTHAMRSLPPVTTVPDAEPTFDAPLSLGARLQIIEDAGPAIQARLDQIVRIGGPMPDTENGAKVIGAMIIDVEGYDGPTEMRSVNGADTDVLGLGAPVYHASTPTERALSQTQGPVTARGGRAASIRGPRRESIFPHINDAEIKLFEDVIPRLPPNARGRIYFTTERVPKGGTVDDLQPYPACSGCIRASFETAGIESGVDLVSFAPPHAPLATGAFPKSTGGASGAVDEAEPSLPATGVSTPRVGGTAQMGIEIGTGLATIGLGLLAAKLKADVDQKIAERQVAAFLAIAKQKINADPDAALKKMMVDPYATVYAWIYLDSAVITTVTVSPAAPEPVLSDSSPLLDLATIDYQTFPYDPSFAAAFPRISAGGLSATTVNTIVIDIPLKTPPLEQLIADAKSRNLPMDDLRLFALGRLQLALSTYEGAAQAKQATADAFQQEAAAYQQIRAAYELARKRKDVKLQQSTAQSLVDVANLEKETAARLGPTEELVKSANEKVTYWQGILKLIDPTLP
jgi:hypothetical protein